MIKLLIFVTFSYLMGSLHVGIEWWARGLQSLGTARTLHPSRASMIGDTRVNVRFARLS